MIGQFFTPEIVADCMFRVAGVHGGQRVIDPSSGDGSFMRVGPKTLEMYGCEIDPQYASVAKQLVPAKCFFQGDALTGLVGLWGTFDLAIGNPPFSAQTSLEKRSEVLQGFDLGAGRASQCLEVLFLELFLKLAKTNGRIAIILPDGPLSNKPFKYVRDWLLCRANVEAIISLPRGIYNGTTAKTNILVAQKRPVAAQSYREATLLLECKELNELKPLRLGEWEKVEPRWKKVVLAEAADWRPEAQGGERQTTDTKTVRLGDVFRVRTGYALYGNKRVFFEEPSEERVLLIRAKNLAPEGGLRLGRNCAYIPCDGEMFCEQSVVRPGEILFVRVGAGCYGRTALMPLGLAAQADDWIHVLTPLAKVDNPSLIEWFNSEAGRSEIRRLAKGVGTLSVSKSSLAELRIPTGLLKSKKLVTETSASGNKVRRFRNRFARQRGTRCTPISVRQ